MRNGSQSNFQSRIRTKRGTELNLQSPASRMSDMMTGTATLRQQPKDKEDNFTNYIKDTLTKPQVKDENWN